MMYKSLALAKDKNRNKINMHSSEKYNHNYLTNENNFQNRPSDIIYTREKLIAKSDKINLPLLNNPSIISSSKNKSNNNNYIIESPSTSAYTNSTKNNLRNDNNLTEQASKFRSGLFSANSLSNNNAIIPFLPIKRPVSNFNFGGNQLWETDEINDVTNLDQAIYKENSGNDKLIIEKYNNIDNAIKLKKEINAKNNCLVKNKNNKKNIFKSTDYKCKSVSLSNRNENMTNNINNNLKIRLDKLRKEKGSFKGIFNIKLIDDKKISNMFNKCNNIFPLTKGGIKKNNMKI